MQSLNLPQRIECLQKANRRTMAVLQVLRRNGRTECERTHSDAMVTAVGRWFSQAPRHIQGGIMCTYRASEKGDGSTTSFKMKWSAHEIEYARIGRFGNHTTDVEDAVGDSTSVFNRHWVEATAHLQTRTARQLLEPIERYIAHQLDQGASVVHLELTDDVFTIMLRQGKSTTSVTVWLTNLTSHCRQVFGTTHVTYH